MRYIVVLLPHRRISMNDLYKEILVKKQSTGTDMLKKVGMIALTVVLAAGGLLIHPLLLLAAVGAGVATWYISTGLDLEYEYLYVNGDIDIDKIMNKQRRKRAASYSFETLELIAPSDSHELDQYRSRAAEKDFTSGVPGTKSYTAVYTADGGLQMVKLELDQELIADIRRMAPRKVSRDCLTSSH